MTWTSIPRRWALLGGFGTVAATAAFGVVRLTHAAADTANGSALSASALFHDPGDPVLGNPAGKLPIAEFFDYRCPYCRAMNPLFQRLLREDQDIRFVAKELPVFGGVSVTAARVSLAGNWQGKFPALHDALFAAAGKLDEASVRAAAEKAGVDMTRLKNDLSTRKAELERILGRVAMQASALGLQGTPGLVIGNYLVPGALSYDTLLEVVAEARRKMSAGH